VNLPQDVLEIVVMDICDIRHLKAFSATCYSWYLAAVPHLHRTLTLEDRLDPTRAELKPLAKLYKMDLLTFVKKLWIRTPSFEPWLLPKKFDRQSLRHFSALTNVQQLRIERFDLSKFMPGIERYFGHFAPTLRSISLTISSGTQLQLLFFLGLFPNLDDIEIEYYPTTNSESTPNPGSELAVPFSIPSLGGQLKLTHFTSETTARDMITLFGGLRFQYMDLFSVEGSRLLLDACSDTLQTVRVYPSVPNKSKQELLRAFDLSHLRSLRCLEVTASSMSKAYQEATRLIHEIFSTIKSPVFSEIVLVFQRPDLYRPYFIPFDMFRQMHSERKFRLVFSLEVAKRHKDLGLQVMELRMGYEVAQERLDFLENPPTLRISEGNSWAR